MPNKPAIQCKYSCSGCGIHRRVVTVAQRGEEDVVQWIEKVLSPVIADDHANASSECRSARMSELLIPTPEGTEKVGVLPGA
jgi:hypothetical protein